MAGPSATRQGRVPNLIIAGVAKAGTTSLFHYAGQHPDICTSDIKELRYFSPLQYGEPLAPLEEYAKHFHHCDEQRYAVEATPGYFYGGQVIAEAIRRTCPSARVVVSLRSPAERCWSFYRFVKSKVRIPKEMTFSEYLDRCEELHRSGKDLDREHGDFSGLVKGCYAQWLPAWTTEFGGQLRILFFEDMVSDISGCVTSLFEWLEIDTSVVDEMAFGVDNKTVQYRRAGLQRAAVLLNRRGQRLFERHPAAKRLLRTGYYSLNRAADDDVMSDAERERLGEFYRPHNATLADQLSVLGLAPPPGWSLPG